MSTSRFARDVNVRHSVESQHAIWFEPGTGAAPTGPITRCGCARHATARQVTARTVVSALSIMAHRSMLDSDIEHGAQPRRRARGRQAPGSARSPNLCLLLLTTPHRKAPLDASHVAG